MRPSDWIAIKSRNAFWVRTPPYSDVVLMILYMHVAYGTVVVVSVGLVVGDAEGNSQYDVSFKRALNSLLLTRSFKLCRTTARTCSLSKADPDFISALITILAQLVLAEFSHSVGP